jgi:hypothetical protein
MDALTRSYLHKAHLSFPTKLELSQKRLYFQDTSYISSSHRTSLLHVVHLFFTHPSDGADGAVSSNRLPTPFHNDRRRRRQV